MSLVGMHIAHKTVKQPNYTWSTFEHVSNAPDCFGLPPSGEQTPVVNTKCPAAESLPSIYNFASKDCEDGSCQSCNMAPNTNDPLGICVTSPSADQVGWCLDRGPAAVAGKSQLCRQIPVEANYPSAHRWNNIFAEEIDAGSVWSNYQLISTQWYEYETVPTTCTSVVNVFQNSSTSRVLQRPQVSIPNNSGATSRPFLGNTSMESYERSNCNGCHSRAYVDKPDGTDMYTDFAYWLPFESCAQWCQINGISPCSCLSKVSN